eukprot:COSAG02_NODE_6696_length_3415_cov_22.626055_2_plen_113_part_00
MNMFGRQTKQRDMLLGKMTMIIPRTMYPADLHFHRYYPRDIESPQKEKAPEEKDVTDINLPQDEQALKKEFELMLAEAGLTKDAKENQGFWTAPPGSAAEQYRNRFSAIFVS